MNSRLRTVAAAKSIEQAKSKVSLTGPRVAVILPETHPLRLVSTAVEVKLTFW